MPSPAAPWKVLPNGPLTAVDDDPSTSLSLDDLPDLPGQLLEWNQDAELRGIASPDTVVIELAPVPWQPPFEVLDARPRVHQAEQQALQARVAAAIDLVALYKAPGGDWNADAAATTGTAAR